MIRSGRAMALALVGACALVLGACGAPEGDSAGTEPVAGGAADVVQITEPSRGLDPAALGNEWVMNAFVGNALYGTLLTNEPGTDKIRFMMAENLSTTDGGATFELTLRKGLAFSDGSPLDAEAVKYNWDRLKDPEVASGSAPEAAMIGSTETVDARTLKITMVDPVPNFAYAVITTSLNWIASPDALEKGPQAFDKEPVGAGPFTMRSWQRQDRMELVKNPDYWDAPKPYLEQITLRTVSDGGQRVNAVMSGTADVAIETNWDNVAKAADAGLTAETVPLSGGLSITMNSRRAPFDDVRARKAVAAALDLEALNLSVYNGKAEPVTTLFRESSPFYADIPLVKHDKALAQRLFDELAAEGKPVSFTFMGGSTTEINNVAESVQAQLSAFRNVEVKVRPADPAKVVEVRSTKEFDMLVGSSHFVDPEPRMYNSFHGDGAANMSGVDDKQLNEALRAGRTGTDEAERKAAYGDVQQRLAELVPVVFFTRVPASVIAAENVGGVVEYGHGSLLPEELWVQQ